MQDQVSHFVGVGGIGMSGLALVLAAQGKQVTGSDLRPGKPTRRLEAAGATIFYGHQAENLGSATRLIYSTAIRPENPELLAARAKGLSICHRSELLAEIAEGYRMIGVSGTHGKTTTSSMIAVMLYQIGLDPTVIVGGEVDALGGNARLGHGPHLVAEVDESDGSLVRFTPEVAVVTNIESDHLDHYRDLSQIVEVFQTYTSQSHFVIASLDCPTIQEHIKADCTYSLDVNSKANYRAIESKFDAQGSVAQILEGEEVLGELRLRVLGRHNLSNALAAVAVGRYLGLSFAQIVEGLGAFRGTHRRFEVMGERDDILFVDDYAHHPSEIQVTLAAARLRGRRVVAIFQPHRYSRSQLLLSEFATAFGDADAVVITDIYSAGEIDTGVIDGRRFADAVAVHHPFVSYEPTLEAVKTHLRMALHRGDLALFLGAGNLNQTIPDLLKADSTAAL
jgi:UDP-N-acetylmuramate--alanine ligase